MSITFEREFFLGADPGASGGLAILEANGAIVDVSPMPDTERDLFEYLNEFGPRIRMGLIEYVASMPKQGVKSMFSFGRSYGAIRMALVASAVPFEEVTAKNWQGAMRCRSKGNKNVTKARAQQLFPRQKITHQIADALLIAEHCRREFGGLNGPKLPFPDPALAPANIPATGECQ